MTAPDTREELVPLRTDFDLVWRGCDRDQVRRYVRSVETELRLLSKDRDAATARADGLVRELEAARVQIQRLSERLDRTCRTPIEPDALIERLRQMAELGQAEATEITARAQAAAEHTVASAREAAATMTRQAEQRRRHLDEQSAKHRQQVESDFELAMAARRAEADRQIRELETTARARAERMVDEARVQAQRIISETRRQVDQLTKHRDQLAAALRTARQLVTDADAVLGAAAEEPGTATAATEPSRDGGGAAA